MVVKYYLLLTKMYYSTTNNKQMKANKLDLNVKNCMLKFYIVNLVGIFKEYLSRAAVDSGNCWPFNLYYL